MAAINSSFGSGGMVCTLSDVDLGIYVIKKVTEFMTEPSHRVLTSVGNVGQQECDPPIWVLRAEVCLSFTVIHFNLFSCLPSSYT